MLFSKKLVLLLPWKRRGRELSLKEEFAIAYPVSRRDIAVRMAPLAQERTMCSGCWLHTLWRYTA